MSTDVTYFFAGIAGAVVIISLGWALGQCLAWCVTEWRRHSRNVDAILGRKHDGWEIDGHAKWDDRRDGPLPRTTDQAARYYDGLIERGEW